MLSQRKARSRFNTALADLRKKTRVDEDIKITIDRSCTICVVILNISKVCY